MPNRYDVIIIGAGPGGYPCAIRLGQLGKRVLVVEQKLLGGLCLNWGCIPTKALSFAAEMVDHLTKAQKMGFQLSNKGLDINTLRSWKEGIVTRLRNGIEYLFKAHKIEFKSGNGKALGEHEVEVISEDEKHIYQADNIVLATGTEVAPLSGLEFDHEFILNTDDALEIREIPDRMLVVGAGASGLEMATIYSRLGSSVTVIEIMDQILPGMDRELCDQLKRMLQKSGIKIMTSARVTGWVKKDGILEVTTAHGDEEEKEQYSKILVTVGRRVVTDAFAGLSIKTNDRGFVSVDNSCQTNLAGIYAIGDLTGPPLLAHKATKQGVQVAEFIAGRKTISVGVIPSCVFTIPPLSSVGLTESEARAQGHDVRTGRFPYRACGKALSMGDSEGVVKIVGTEEGKLLGVHILGAESSSLIGEGIIAIDKGLGVADLAHSVHPHPTLTEMMQEAAENFYKKAIHTVNK